MTIKRIISDKVKEAPPKTWSNCLVVGDQFFVSGMTAHDLDGNVAGGKDMYSQSRQTFLKIQALVEAAGARMNDIVKMTIFVTDISERKEVWRAREEFFTGNFPACSLIGISALATPELKVEIEATGFINASDAG
ncbi:RidA family protein [Mesorhizobium sp. CN2-181]|uniref:RidA family protein n=1 Tax=Mesorhizobium yinganensis TaxID=3157707 RepID=UPI0032B82A14